MDLFIESANLPSSKSAEGTTAGLCKVGSKKGDKHVPRRHKRSIPVIWTSG